jgi:hypothetical protein
LQHYSHSPRHGKNLGVHEWRRCDAYKIEYCQVFKKKEILPFAITWMNLENNMLSETSQTQEYYVGNPKKLNS